MTWFPINRIEAADSTSIDAFGRWRTSDPLEIASMRFLHDKQPDLWDEALSGGGTSVYQTNQSSVLLSVPDTTASSVIRQTFLTYNYQPGKSQLMFMSAVPGESAAGITRRLGLFNGEDGLYLEINPTSPAFGVRSSTSGSPIDTLFPQSSWNHDKLDGNGKSGFTLDTSKIQIFFVDFQWLGVGRVRFGFVIDGVAILCHEAYHANIESTVYMSTPNLPLRHEIINDGTGAAANTTQICSAVVSEGGQNPIGKSNALSTGIVSDNFASGSTYARIGLRLNSAKLDTQVILTSLNLQSSAGNDIYSWKVVINPTVAGTVSWTPVANSAMDMFIGDDTNTVSLDGRIVTQGVAVGEVIISLPQNENQLLGSAIDGTADELFIIFEPANAQELYASLGWKEPI